MPNNNNKKNDISSLSFEQAINELELIVRELEQNDGELEESIAKFARGMELKKYCEQKLANAKLQVEQIKQNADGTISAESKEFT